jgi:hypothetical protein
MDKSCNTVPLYVLPETRNQIKSKAALEGVKIYEYMATRFPAKKGKTE